MIFFLILRFSVIWFRPVWQQQWNEQIKIMHGSPISFTIFFQTRTQCLYVELYSRWIRWCSCRRRRPFVFTVTAAATAIALALKTEYEEAKTDTNRDLVEWMYVTRWYSLFTSVHLIPLACYLFGAYERMHVFLHVISGSHDVPMFALMLTHGLTQSEEVPVYTMESPKKRSPSNAMASCAIPICCNTIRIYCN